MRVKGFGNLETYNDKGVELLDRRLSVMIVARWLWKKKKTILLTTALLVVFIAFMASRIDARMMCCMMPEHYYCSDGSLHLLNGYKVFSEEWLFWQLMSSNPASNENALRWLRMVQDADCFE